MYPDIKEKKNKWKKKQKWILYAEAYSQLEREKYQGWLDNILEGVKNMITGQRQKDPETRRRRRKIVALIANLYKDQKRLDLKSKSSTEQCQVNQH